MDNDFRKYKNVHMLFSKNKGDIFNIKEGIFVTESDNKVIIKLNKEISEMYEIQLIWETTKIERVQEISKDGKVISNEKMFKEVNEANIWIDNKDYPYVYVFVNKIVLLRDIQKIFVNLFNVELKNIEFNNVFYERLIESFEIREIKSVSYQTNEENLSSITISTKGSLMASQIYNETDILKEKITEITVLLNKYLKIKIYRRGKLLIYNTPDMYEIIHIVSFIRSLMSDGGIIFE